MDKGSAEALRQFACTLIAGLIAWSPMMLFAWAIDQALAGR